MKKLIEKQGNYIAYLQGVIRALRMMSGIKEASLNIKSERKYESEIAALKEEKEEKNEPPKYYKCPECGSLMVYEKGQMPYWLPTAEAHQRKAGLPLCKTKYVEITEEEYIEEIEILEGE